MQFYDMLMVAVLAGTMLFGFWKGMAWQLASLASVVLSAVAAVRLGPRFAPLFGETEPWNRFIAMLVVYLVVALAIWIVFRLVANMIDRVKLKEFDRQVGALFGLAKGALWCILITFFVVTLSEQARQAVLGTYSGRYIALFIKSATPVLPAEVTNTLGGYIEQLDKKLDPNTPPDATAGEDLKNLGKDLIGELQQGLEQSANQTQNGVNDKINGKIDELRQKAADTLNKAKSGLQK